VDDGVFDVGIWWKRTAGGAGDMRLFLVIFASLSLLGPAKADQAPFVGEIVTFYFAGCPVNYLPTDGRLINILDNTALFSILGTTYGGDGRFTFALPLLNPQFTTGQTAVAVTSCIAVHGVFPPR
jgi:microcystin-dependent protein